MNNTCIRTIARSVAARDQMYRGRAMPAHHDQTFHLDDVIEDATAQRIEPMYTYADVASALKVSVQTVEVWVKRGQIPSPLYIGSTSRFTVDHLRKIRLGVKLPQTYEVTDSPRAAASRAGKTKARAKKLAAAKKITRKPAAPPRPKGKGAK